MPSSPTKVKQVKRTLTDPTAYGHTFMPPWSVKCPDDGTEVVSYGNNPTTKCPKCGKHVRPTDHQIKTSLPPHGKVGTDGRLTPIEKDDAKKPPRSTRYIK